MRSELEADLAEQIWALHLEAPLEVAEPERADVLATALGYGATVYDARSTSPSAAPWICRC